MKKLSQVNEGGFWKSGIQRAKTNTERIGDRLNANIKDLDVVDMGIDEVLFADKDLVIEGEEKFEWEDVQRYIPFIEEHGWRIPTVHEMQKWFYKNDGSLEFDNKRFDVTPFIRMEEFNDEPFFVIKSWDTKEKLYFQLPEDYLSQRNLNYWLLGNGGTDTEYGRFAIVTDHSRLSIGHTFYAQHKFLKIRLVKDKK